jgi:hypothetical protein
MTILGLVVGTILGIAFAILLVIGFWWLPFIGLGNTTTIVSFIQLAVLLTILGAVIGYVIGGIIGFILGLCAMILVFIVRRLWAKWGKVEEAHQPGVLSSRGKESRAKR